MRTDRLAEVWRLSRLPKSWQCVSLNSLLFPEGLTVTFLCHPHSDIRILVLPPCTLPSAWCILLCVPAILGMDQMGSEMTSEDVGRQKAGTTRLWFLLTLFLAWSPKISPIPKVGQLEKAPISLGSWRWLLLAREGVIILVSGKRNRWLFPWLMTVVPGNLSRSMLTSRLPQSQFTSSLSPVPI